MPAPRPGRSNGRLPGPDTTWLNPLRAVRAELDISRSTMAERLGVALETYRPWETGRRPVPAEILLKACQLAGHAGQDEWLPLPTLAGLLKVHVRTLRQAARDGRLAVTFDQRTYFGRPIPLATRAAGRAFLHVYYRKTTRWSARPPRPRSLASAPLNYHAQLIRIRLRLGLTQSQLAKEIGAASKAVVYQWESRKRMPSPVFWSRVLALCARSPKSRRTGVGPVSS